ncbi:RNA-binding S4 domain-containing protein [Alphaproteobacteria bacterium]|nr:RNA-binding S4 domain-containing protein [Alphaproteobacteria bacterium]
MRLDKWLWNARFFKTRSAASKAILSGRFRLDGQVITKPHRQALCGQVLTFVQGDRVRVIKVVAIGTRRGPAPEAALLFEDLAPVEATSSKAAKTKLPEFEARGKGSGRPTKLQRRETDRLKTRLESDEG